MKFCGFELSVLVHNFLMFDVLLNLFVADSSMVTCRKSLGGSIT